MRKFIILATITILAMANLANAQVIRGRDPNSKIREVQVDTTGVLYTNAIASDTVYVEWAKVYEDFINDTTTVSTTLDSVTFSPIVETLGIYTPDEDVYVWINDSTGAPILLEQSASWSWGARRFSISKVYLQKVAAGNSKVYLTGNR